MPLSWTNVAIVLGLLGWTLVLLRRAAQRRDESTNSLLFISLALVVASRALFMVEAEPNADTSTWLAAALTVAERKDALWTLLTYSDSRPLTVLPLAVAVMLGAPANYIIAEIVGLLFWLGTLVTCHRLLHFVLRPSASLLACWTLALFVATTSYGDHIAYNSESVAIFLTSLATYFALRLAWTGEDPWWSYAALGLLLGTFPFAKMQIVPAGFVLAAFTGITLLRQRNGTALVSLLVGGLLPALFVSGYYASRREWSYFWDTYFWRYYYYSYSEELSALPLDIRFRPGRIVRFIYGNGWSGVYLGGLTAVLTLTWVAMQRRRMDPPSLLARYNLGLSLLLLVTTVYAVLQAGNNHEHYVLLVLVPLLHAACACAAQTPRATRYRLATIGLAAATLQATVNAWYRVPTPLANRAEQRIAQQIRSHSTARDAIVVWGYADRLHILANRPMGYRYANTFYIYSPLVALKELDLQHFIADMEKNRPALFIDAALPHLSLFGDPGYQHDHFPLPASYIGAHYRQVANVEGARIYERVDHGGFSTAPASGETANTR
jgi:hypothetical protein